MQTVCKRLPVSRFLCATLASAVAVPSLSLAQPESHDFGFPGVIRTVPDLVAADPELAVSQTHVLAVTNQDVVLFRKDGTRVFEQPFFGSTGFWDELPICDPCSEFGFDPLAFYDDEHDRFWIVCFEKNSANLLVAVSGVNPELDPWKKYRVFNHTDVPGEAGQFLAIDRPNASIHDDEIYVSFWGRWCDGVVSDPYDCDGTQESPVTAVIILDKEEILATPSGQTLQNVNGFLMPNAPVDFWRKVQAFHGVKADVTDPAPLYMVEIDRTHPKSGNGTGPFNEIIVHAVTNPWAPTPTLTTAFIPLKEQYWGPTVIPQSAPPPPATAPDFEPTDARILDAVYRFGSLWAVHHISETQGGKTVARWYKIQLNGFPAGTPQLVAYGTIRPKGNRRAFYPSIAVNGAGTAMVTYNQSGPQEWVSIRRRNLTTGEDHFVKLSSDFYDDTTQGDPQRWGDYSGTEPDPADPCGFWGHHMFVGDEISLLSPVPMAGDWQWRTYIYNWTDFPNCVSNAPESKAAARAFADLTRDGEVDLFDLVAFQDLFRRRDVFADLNRDGAFDAFDLIEFQQFFAMAR